MKVDELLRTWDWHPIRNCPGRYVLAGSRIDISVQQVLAEDVVTMEYRVEAVPDAVLVVKLVDGGLISYKRHVGSFLHTLNTAEGFERKLSQLGIALL